MKETVHHNSVSSPEIKKPVLKDKKDVRSQNTHSEDWIDNLNQEQLPSLELSPDSRNQPEFLTTKDENKFRVKLQVFEGPLELLLSLVREHELNINDIPIVFITDQYLEYVNLMKNSNINLASEYLVMASWLIYIKSRTLLPQSDGEELPEEDPEMLRQELQKQLIEYQKFKNLSGYFKVAEEEQSLHFERGGDQEIESIVKKINPEEDGKIILTTFELMNAMKNMLELEDGENVHLIEIEELEVADRQNYILDFIKNLGSEGIAFDKILENKRTLTIVATFLALLELVKRSLIVVFQNHSFSEIRIKKAVLNE
ncbi:MAG: segregation/condensation protein A [Nitrospinota bacterium]|nr:segregation/condensation protein A [Nitrospinota bacterium]